MRIYLNADNSHFMPLGKVYGAMDFCDLNIYSPVNSNCEHNFFHLSTMLSFFLLGRINFCDLNISILPLISTIVNCNFFHLSTMLSFFLLDGINPMRNPSTPLRETKLYRQIFKKSSHKNRTGVSESNRSYLRTNEQSSLSPRPGKTIER